MRMKGYPSFFTERRIWFHDPGTKRKRRKGTTKNKKSKRSQSRTRAWLLIRNSYRHLAMKPFKMPIRKDNLKYELLNHSLQLFAPPNARRWWNRGITSPAYWFVQCGRGNLRLVMDYVVHWDYGFLSLRSQSEIAPLSTAVAVVFSYLDLPDNSDHFMTAPHNFPLLGFIVRRSGDCRCLWRLVHAALHQSRAFRGW